MRNSAVANVFQFQTLAIGAFSQMRCANVDRIQNGECDAFRPGQVGRMTRQSCRKSDTLAHSQWPRITAHAQFGGGREHLQQLDWNATNRLGHGGKMGGDDLLEFQLVGGAHLDEVTFGVERRDKT